MPTDLPVRPVQLDLPWYDRGWGLAFMIVLVVIPANVALAVALRIGARYLGWL